MNFMDRRELMVMPANQTNELVHLWSGLYGNLGHLYTPARTDRVRPWLPYALDNGQFSNVKHGRTFNPDEFRSFVDRFMAAFLPPIFIAVPDQPYDRERTLAMWDDWQPSLLRTVQGTGVALAMCVQDDMTPEDVRPRLRSKDFVFVAGTTDWKRDTVPMWASEFRTHVGRMNSPTWLYELAALGVESCDGSGWFRGKSPQVVGLGRFLAHQAGKDQAFAAECALATRYQAREQGVLRLEDERCIA